MAVGLAGHKGSLLQGDGPSLVTWRCPLRTSDRHGGHDRTAMVQLNNRGSRPAVETPAHRAIDRPLVGIFTDAAPSFLTSTSEPATPAPIPQSTWLQRRARPSQGIFTPRVAHRQRPSATGAITGCDSAITTCDNGLQHADRRRADAPAAGVTTQSKTGCATPQSSVFGQQ